MQVSTSANSTSTPFEPSAYGQSEEIFRRSLWNLMSNLTVTPGVESGAGGAKSTDTPRQHQDN